jgi:beta-fructofuranosidase
VLRLRDEWVWDSWVADDGERYHLYFLKAPRSLVDPARRHTAATIGHATSADLRTWEYHGEALAPVASGWDDLALWTGSIARATDGIWRMYYTGLSRRDGRGMRDQRIGMAESEDLFAWRRVGDRTLVEADSRWYTTLPEDANGSDTWRDPFVFPDPDGGGWHMLISARWREDDEGAGVLGHAHSEDMRTWEVRAPLSSPAGFEEVEVPQVRCVSGRSVLVFTCHPDKQTAARRREFGAHSTWVVLGDSATGPWDLGRAEPFAEEPRLFAAPLVQDREGDWVFLGFKNEERATGDAFEIVDPIRVRLSSTGLVPC